MRPLVFFLLRLTGLPFLLRELVQCRRVSILCYHDPRPQDFERHLQVLTRVYNPISLQRYLDARRDSTIRLPRKALVLTFDDGHRGNYHLKDILQRFQVPATIFLCSGIAGTGRAFWWKNLAPDAREQLKRVSNAERKSALSARGCREREELGTRQALSLEEIEQMRGLVTFESHSRFHPILPRCSEVEAIEEIVESRRELEESLGATVRAFAYPNGDYSARDVEIARRAGYECAVTIDGGYNGERTDAYRLRRLRISDQAGSSELIVKASGLWTVAEWLRNERSMANDYAAGADYSHASSSSG